MKSQIKALLIATLAASALSMAKADNTAIHTPEGFQVLGLSPNGKWACGVYIDAAMNTYGFRWDLESDDIEMLSNETSTAYDIANDGTVSGEYIDHTLTHNGAGLDTPGFWRDGVWHHVESPTGTIATGGIGYGISPDGHYMTGALPIDGIYTAFIWKDGAIHRKLESTNHAVGFAVSPDGNSATGFSTRYNRTACYWAANGDVTYFDDSQYAESPWNYGRSFSPDGKKLLYWGGWDLDDEGNNYLYSIYNIETGERVKVPAPSYDSDLEYFDISNSGLLVGTDHQRGYVWTGEEGMVIDDYLAMRGIDLSGFDDFYGGEDYYQGQLPIFRVVGVNEDDNVLAMQYYNGRGQVSSMVIKADQDFSILPPARVKASQLQGLNTVGVTWKRPVGATSIRGYNVYRNGKKLNGFLPLTSTNYYDKGLEPGIYEYQVSTINLAGIETRGDIIAVEVAAPQWTEQPMSMFTRQKGINNGYATWHAPMSTRTHRHYYGNADDIIAFNVYEPVEVEMAVRYEKAEIANYSDHKVAEVSFYPMGDLQGWKVNLYTHDSDGKLKQLYSQPITQKLELRTLNTVVLDEPQAVPDGDLIVAIAVIGDETVQETLGGDPTRVTIGCSDLLRQTSEDDFYSAFNRSAAGGMTISCIAWAIDLGLEAPSYSAEASVLSHYNIYVDGENVGQTDQNSMVAANLSDGIHTLGAEAVYADGSVSAMTEADVKIAGNYPRISEVAVEAGVSDIKASWAAPIDEDRTNISYVDAIRPSNGIKGTEDNGYAMIVGAEYPASMLRGMEGYKIKGMRFYPLADAIFTFILFEDNHQIYELEVDDFTIGRWNEIEVPDDIEIKANCTYFLALDCFDPEPDVKLMAIDGTMPIAYKSDLYSIDNGGTWNSLSTDTSIQGNWMIGLTIADPNPQDVEVEGYDVVVDDKVINSTLVQGTQYDCDLGDNDAKRHSLRIDAHYPGREKAVSGTSTYFYLQSGIIDAISDIKLQQGSNYLTAKGDGIESITVIATDGKEVAKAKGDTVEISHLSAGVYVVQIQANGMVTKQKVTVRF